MDVDVSSKRLPVMFLRNADDIDAIIASFPGPVSISPSRRAWSGQARLIGRFGVGLVIVLLSIPFAILAVNAISIGSLGWGLFALAGLSFWLFCLVAISLGAMRPYFLVLDKDGFTAGGGWTYQSCRWTDVRDFHLAGIIRFARIRFKNFSPSARGRVVLGLGEDWLKFLIPYRDKALATLMNRWRERALAAPDSQERVA